jgi:hypothetical protein
MKKTGYGRDRLRQLKPVPAEQHRDHSHDNTTRYLDRFPLHNSGKSPIFANAQIMPFRGRPDKHTVRAGEYNYGVIVSFTFQNNDPEEFTLVNGLLIRNKNP